LLAAVKLMATLLLFIEVDITEFEVVVGFVLSAKTEVAIVKRAMIVVVKFFIFVGF
jgi:hypothetical protein